MSDNGHILVVDDQQEIRDVVQEYLTGEGFRVSTAHDGAGMRRVLSQSAADLVILDANPLADIRNIRRVHLVVAEGKVFQPDALRKKVDIN